MPSDWFQNTQLAQDRSSRPAGRDLVVLGRAVVRRRPPGPIAAHPPHVVQLLLPPKGPQVVLPGLALQRIAKGLVPRIGERGPVPFERRCTDVAEQLARPVGAHGREQRVLLCAGRDDEAAVALHLAAGDGEAASVEGEVDAPRGIVAAADRVPEAEVQRLAVPAAAADAAAVQQDLLVLDPAAAFLLENVRDVATLERRVDEGDRRGEEAREDKGREGTRGEPDGKLELLVQLGVGRRIRFGLAGRGGAPTPAPEQPAKDPPAALLRERVRAPLGLSRRGGAHRRRRSVGPRDGPPDPRPRLLLVPDHDLGDLPRLLQRQVRRCEHHALDEHVHRLRSLGVQADGGHVPRGGSLAGPELRHEHLEVEPPLAPRPGIQRRVRNHGAPARAERRRHPPSERERDVRVHADPRPGLLRGVARGGRARADEGGGGGGSRGRVGGGGAGARDGEGLAVAGAGRGGVAPVGRGAARVRGHFRGDVGVDKEAPGSVGRSGELSAPGEAAPGRSCAGQGQRESLGYDPGLQSAVLGLFRRRQVPRSWRQVDADCHTRCRCRCRTRGGIAVGCRPRSGPLVILGVVRRCVGGMGGGGSGGRHTGRGCEGHLGEHVLGRISRGRRRGRRRCGMRTRNNACGSTCRGGKEGRIGVSICFRSTGQGKRFEGRPTGAPRSAGPRSARPDAADAKRIKPTRIPQNRGRPGGQGIPDRSDDSARPDAPSAVSASSPARSSATTASSLRFLRRWYLRTAPFVKASEAVKSGVIFIAEAAGRKLGARRGGPRNEECPKF
ncbi:hypothetical protein DFJ74DRAFT_674839 [Hyaloraphidium curvatum]|nr:hypothetical protein DFJ74DRAFT_674839 [Hyaloraphidium curvatum]